MRTGSASAARFLCCLISVCIAAPLVAGSLTPPGTPAPTMKTLDEVEPATAVQSLGAGPTYIISQPGSYYLTDNIDFTGASAVGITINCDNVTIDLRGFKIDGTNVAAGAIYATGRSNITVCNGMLKECGYGFSAMNSTNAVLRNLTITGCATNAIYAGQSSTVENCTATACDKNGGAVVIYTGSGSAVRSCTVRNNGPITAGTCIGIQVGSGSTVEGNTVSANATVGPGTNNYYMHGIVADAKCAVLSNTVSDQAAVGSSFASGINCWGAGSRIAGNVCSGITVSGTFPGAGSFGIYVTGADAWICDNNVSTCGPANTIAYGIYATGNGAAILRNVCNNATGGSSATSAGIYANGSRVRIEDNHCGSNLGASAGYGIRVGTGTGNVVRGNTTAGNLTAGIRFDATTGTYCAENMNDETTPISNPGTNAMGTGDRANVAF